MNRRKGEAGRYDRRRKGRGSAGAGESSAFLRLLTAMAVVLLCLAGQQRFPAQAEVCRQRLAQVLTSSTDFSAAFQRLGVGLESGEDVLESVGGWCMAVFAPEPMIIETREDTSEEEPPADTSEELPPEGQSGS